MNIRLNLLELFYYVNRYGGFEQAARKLPYGIQPPTIRRQLCELEKLVGQRLYDRHPFKLTSVGENLLVSTNAIFEVVEELKGKIGRWRTAGPEIIRIGASTIVFRDHLPALLPSLQRDFPELRLKFKEGFPSQIEGWLKEGSIDVGITLHDGDVPAGYLSELLLRLPMALVVPESSRLRSANELWRQSRIQETLICPPSEDVISRTFQECLQRYDKEWPPGMEPNSMGLMESYVERGFEIGVTAILPGQGMRPGLRMLPLREFRRLPLMLIWRRHPSAAVRALLNQCRRAVTEWLQSRKDEEVVGDRRGADDDALQIG